jgi:hypothetical protein
VPTSGVGPGALRAGRRCRSVVDDGEDYRTYLVGLGRAFEVVVVRLDADGRYPEAYAVLESALDWGASNATLPDDSAFGAGFGYELDTGENQVTGADNAVDDITGLKEAATTTTSRPRWARPASRRPTAAASRTATHYELQTSSSFEGTVGPFAVLNAFGVPPLSCATGDALRGGRATRNNPQHGARARAKPAPARAETVRSMPTSATCCHFGSKHAICAQYNRLGCEISPRFVLAGGR